MATFENIILDAYFLMGKKSPDQNSALSTNDVTLALRGMNYIIAHHRKMPWFNVQLQQVDTTDNTQFIYIGETVTSSETNVSVINKPFFSNIIGATVEISNTRYVVNVYPLTELDNTRLTRISGKPNAIYYDNFLDDSNNYYTKIFVNPSNNNYTIHLIGSAGLSDVSLETDTVLNGFDLFLTYEIARYLAGIFSRMEQWNSQNEAYRNKIKDEFISQNLNLGKPRSTNRLTKQTGSFQIFDL